MKNGPVDGPQSLVVEVVEQSASYRPRGGSPQPVVVHVPGFSGDALTDAPFAIRLAAEGFQCHILQPPWANTPQLSDPSPALLFELLDEAEARLEALVAAIARREDASDWVALTGFSMGGMFVSRILTRERGHPFAAAAMALSSGDWSFLPRTTLDAFPELRAAIPVEMIGLAERVLRDQSPIAHIERVPPTPLLMVNVDRDPWLPLSVARHYHDRLEEAYAAAGRPDALHFEVHQGQRHEFRRAMQRRVRDWLAERRAHEPAG